MAEVPFYTHYFLVSVITGSPYQTLEEEIQRELELVMKADPNVVDYNVKELNDTAKT